MYKVYIVEPGETIDSIAKNLNITTTLLNEINGFDINTVLEVGDQIIIPKTNNSNGIYIVKRGDNPYSIAQKYNISVDDLLMYNGLEKDDYIYPNQKILIPNMKQKYYVTKSGDTINNLSNKMNLPINKIIELNDNIYLIPDQMLFY